MSRSFWNTPETTDYKATALSIPYKFKVGDGTVGGDGLLAVAFERGSA